MCVCNNNWTIFSFRNETTGNIFLNKPLCHCTEWHGYSTFLRFQLDSISTSTTFRINERSFKFGSRRTFEINSFTRHVNFILANLKKCKMKICIHFMYWFQTVSNLLKLNLIGAKKISQILPFLNFSLFFDAFNETISNFCASNKKNSNAFTFQTVEKN